MELFLQALLPALHSTEQPQHSAAHVKVPYLLVSKTQDQSSIIEV